MGSARHNHLTKMKKLFFVIVAAVMSVTTVFAQSSMLATLSHEGNVNVYYGPTALREAHAAAVHGDVITLSSGIFLSTDITKAVTIRGAGMGIDPTVVTEPTIISGEFQINISDTVTNHLTMEGIYSNYYVYYKGTLKNAMFMKCRFRRIVSRVESDVLKNAKFIHCRVAAELNLTKNSSASCINSVIYNPRNKDDGSSTFDFVNCFVPVFASYLFFSSFRNCVIRDDDSMAYLRDTNVAYNCIGLGGGGIFNQMKNQTNVYVDDVKSVFKSYSDGSIDGLDRERFELTDEAQEKYLGDDGTQVGIYGGSFTYDPVPTNPQITKCNVAAKSTADGKLSVDIQVTTAE